MRDGRRLHRLAAAAIVENRSGQVMAVIQTERDHGAGLWGDGNEVIVLEQWNGHAHLPDDLRQEADVVVAELRRESRARGKWPVFNPPSVAKQLQAKAQSER